MGVFTTLLLGGSALGGLAAGKEFLVDPIRRQHFPDTLQLKNDFLNREPNAQDGYDFTEDDLYRYRRSELDDIVQKRYGTPDALEQYIRDEQAGRKKRAWESDPQGRYNRDRIAQKDKIAAKELEYRKTQDAYNRTDQMIALERADALERYTREQEYRRRSEELGLRRDKMENDNALLRLDLLDRQGRQDWQQQQFEKQLTLDEEQRLRDQKKFYALLGSSILSEGVKALF